MKVLFILLFTFLGLGVPTAEQDAFNEVVHKNYDYYEVIIEEETSIGDVQIVRGAVNKKMYISVFLYQTEENLHKIVIDNEITQEKVINIHKYRLQENVEVKILSEGDVFFKTYVVENIEYEDFENIAIKGDGKNNFPRQKLKLDIFDIFLFMMYGFIGLIGIFTLVLLTLYRKKIGKFGQTKPVQPQNDYGDNDYIDVEYNYQPVEEEPEKTEEELMKEAYEDYNNGKITEQELNNRLRNIWWSNKDD